MTVGRRAASTRLAAVIFDCDGVLFDSWRANVAYYDAIRAHVGLPAMDAAWRKRVHFLAASSVHEEMFGGDPSLREAARAAAREIAYDPFFSLMEPVDGLHEVLATLRRHHRLGMATNRSRTVAEVVRRWGLGEWLEVAVGLLDVERPKPHPDVIERALERLGVQPAEALYVGDAETDLAAARAAGVEFVAVGAAPWASARIPRLADLPAWLGSG